jgi:hypothetical protein
MRVSPAQLQARTERQAERSQMRLGEVWQHLGVGSYSSSPSSRSHAAMSMANPKSSRWRS